LTASLSVAAIIEPPGGRLKRTNLWHERANPRTGSERLTDIGPKV
jgi:hypothetical protein